MRIASLPRKLAGGKCRVVGDRATAFEFRRSLSEISDYRLVRRAFSGDGGVRRLGSGARSA